MLTLIPPGARKGNRYWLARGRVNGRLVEISTRALDKAGAERFAARFAARLWDAGAGDRPGSRTFDEAVAAYVAWRRPHLREEARLARVAGALGARPVEDLTQADIVRAIQDAWPGRSPASWNRDGIAPIAAVVHYAASNGWCPYRRIPRFREPPVTPRALSEAEARAIIAGAGRDPATRRLVLLLFGLAQRITDTVAMTWADIDMGSKTARVRVSKTGRVIALPIPDALLDELARTPPAARAGKLVGFNDRWQAYDALAALRARTGIQWTPHQARHTVGTLLARSGASRRAIMAALGHANVKSSMRYQDGDLEMVRDARAKILRPRAPRR